MDGSYVQKVVLIPLPRAFLIPKWRGELVPFRKKNALRLINDRPENQ